MKKYVEGKYIEMSQEEVAELEAFVPDCTNEEPSLLDRLEAIEAALLEGVLSNG